MLGDGTAETLEGRSESYPRVLHRGHNQGTGRGWASNVTMLDQGLIEPRTKARVFATRQGLHFLTNIGLRLTQAR